ncbi:hypothetical protein CK203_069552 [Vitis vinifera]|uniref:Uncharacterized protein n=1 Tax=Vitis vinifera TaxID=29760 RepID=A0A438EKU5_VITVI|nr:hypothetical protein CK203_069552 [Vitis vinifera]
MSSIFQSFKANGLPVSHADSKEQGLRRRLSSFSFKIQPICSTPSSWRFPRSKSLPSMGEFGGSSMRKWWDLGWAWILSRKPTFAKDLEMNEEETVILGCHNKGSWRHVFYKVRSELRRLVGSDRVGLPQTCRYDSYSYSQNFDQGNTAIHG